MPLFKSRKKGGEPVAAPAAAESIEVLRRRARHRLIGAAVLVLAGVIGFPLLFDTQPRPVAIDVPIEIPDRDKVPPLVLPAATPAMVDGGKLVAAPAPKPGPAPASAPAAASAPAPAPAAASAPAPAIASAPAPAKVAAAPVQSPAPAPVPAATPERPAESAPAKKPEPKPENRTADKADDGARARALLQGKDADTVAAAGRYVVQVGAFADAGKAREVRLKVERAGLKTYTHVAETREGRRIRVRVGPFSSRADADRAADKVKGLDLPAAILTL